MRFELLVPKALRLILAAAAAALLAACLGCAKIPLIGGKPAVSMRVTATQDCNSCGRPVGYPLTLRILQVTDATGMTGASLAQLWDHEDKLLGASLIAKSEEVLDPGSRKEWKVGADPKAKAVVVVGNFCKTEGNCWFLTKPMKGGSASLKLKADASCLREAR